MSKREEFLEEYYLLCLKYGYAIDSSGILYLTSIACVQKGYGYVGNYIKLLKNGD